MNSENKKLLSMEFLIKMKDTSFNNNNKMMNKKNTICGRDYLFLHTFVEDHLTIRVWIYC